MKQVFCTRRFLRENDHIAQVRCVLLYFQTGPLQTSDIPQKHLNLQKSLKKTKHFVKRKTI